MGDRTLKSNYYYYYVTEPEMLTGESVSDCKRQCPAAESGMGKGWANKGPPDSFATMPVQQYPLFALSVRCPRMV